MTAILQDLRFAARQLRKSPGVTLTAIFSLACGIAATTAVFSVVWAVLMRPYPYAAPDRLVHLTLGGLSGQSYDSFGVNATQYQEITSVPAIESAILIEQRNLTVTGGDLPEDVRASSMTANAFQFFGVPTHLGRGILPSDAPAGQDPQPVVVLSYRFWQHRYNADPAILGKSIQLAHIPYTVVGVADRRFTWNDADLYLPLKLTAGPLFYAIEARLKPGISHTLADQQLQPLVTQFAHDNPQHFPVKIFPLHVIGLNEQFVGSLGPTLAFLFAAVTLLLAIGCGNVSILLLARGLARQHEFAVRAAIGASRLRIARQLLTEALLLSFTGAALGVLLAYRFLAVIITLLPEYAFPHEAAISINTPRPPLQRRRRPLHRHPLRPLARPPPVPP